MSPPLPLTVVADSIRSAFNVGGIFHAPLSVWCANCCCVATRHRPTNRAARAAGTERLVAWRHAGGVREAIDELRAAGVPCVALETVANAPSVGAFAWPLPCALVVGNERFGLDPDVVRACDAVVRIPLAGRKIR